MSLQQSTSNSIAQNDNNDDLLQQQTYQNLSEIKEHAVQPIRDEIYANQEQIQQCQQNTEGIYDNDCMINAQMKMLAIEKSNLTQITPNSTENSNMQPIKPPVAAKPSNLQQKIKALNNAGLSVSTVDKFIPPPTTTVTTAGAVGASNHNEPLKIIEDEQDLYCNTKANSMESK